SAVEVQQLQFERPANFDPAAFLAGSFGIFQGDGPAQIIRVRFSAAVSRVVRERNHHPSQRPFPQPDGSLIVEFELSSLEEFSSWIPSFGEHAEVLEPAELRGRIKERLSASLEKYQAPRMGDSKPEPNGKPTKAGRKVRPK